MGAVSGGMGSLGGEFVFCKGFNVGGWGGLVLWLALTDLAFA